MKRARRVDPAKLRFRPVGSRPGGGAVTRAVPSSWRASYDLVIDGVTSKLNAVYRTYTQDGAVAAWRADYGGIPGYKLTDVTLTYSCGAPCLDAD